MHNPEIKEAHDKMVDFSSANSWAILPSKIKFESRPMGHVASTRPKLLNKSTKLIHSEALEIFFISEFFLSESLSDWKSNGVNKPEHTNWRMP